MKKSELKNSFLKGSKPKERDFHGLLESYIHKTDDEDLTIDENTKNVGIGIQSPGAKLHVNGGLIIGNVPDPDENGVQIFQGTLRWADSKLEIFVGDTWKTVWQDGAGSVNSQSLPDRIVFPSSLEMKFSPSIRDEKKVDNNIRDFPNNALRINSIQFEFQCDLNNSSRSAPAPTLVIGMEAGNGAAIWEMPQPIVLSEGYITTAVYAIGIDIRNIVNFRFYYKVTRQTIGGRISIFPKAANIDYSVSRGQ